MFPPTAQVCCPLLQHSSELNFLFILKQMKNSIAKVCEEISKCLKTLEAVND
jgi:hypothetical protein